MTAKTTPRAMVSLLFFNKRPNTISVRIDPNVIILPKFPCDFIISIPAIKVKSVKRVIKRKEPSRVEANPIKKPTNKSFLFIPFEGVKLLYGIMCCQIILYGNH